MFLILSFMASQVRAQTIFPTSIDFGTVAGDVIVIVTVTGNNIGITNVEVTSDDIGDIDAFVIEGWYGNAIVLGDDPVDFSVEFTPPNAGSYSADLEITFGLKTPFGGWEDAGTEIVELIGYGVEEEITIDSLIDFFDTSIANETLQITGRRWAKWFRYFAMKNTLKYTRRLINAGYYRWAGYYLNSILMHADGSRWPRDYVTGSARVQFAQHVRDLISGLQGSG